jgi:hypothetical protein
MARRPRNAPTATGRQGFILRWFHPLVWLLLAASFFVRGSALPAASGMGDLLGLAALLTYVLYIVTLLSRRG